MSWMKGHQRVIRHRLGVRVTEESHLPSVVQSDKRRLSSVAELRNMVSGVGESARI